VEPKTGPRLSKAQIEAFGKSHNQALDAILAQLKQTTSPPKTPLRSIINEVKKSALQYNASQVTLDGETQNKLVDRIDFLTGIFTAGMKNGRTQSNSLQPIGDAISPYVTSGQRSHINAVLDAVDYYELNYSYFQMTLNQIEASAYNLPYGEADLPLIAVSIARSSGEYWQANQATWNQYVNGGNTPIERTNALTWRFIVGSDIGGALVGATVAGWIAIFAPPIGWAAALSYTATVSAVGSALGALLWVASRTESYEGQAINLDVTSSFRILLI